MSQRQLLLATTNPGKIREASAIIDDLDFDLITLSSYPNIEAVAETADTFAGNAELKACGYATQTHILTIADDSGLEVDALGGAPGVRSARFISPSTSYEERNRHLLSFLSTAGSRAARFVCVVAIASPDGILLHKATGTCAGRISTGARGDGGFGYDPIFIPEGYEETFGELPARIKNQISHRARALLAVRKFLVSLTAGSARG